MNPPKRRAKRIQNHPRNEDINVHEDEKLFLNMFARIAVEIFLKEMEEENLEKEPNVPGWKRQHKKSILYLGAE